MGPEIYCVSLNDNIINDIVPPKSKGKTHTCEAQKYNHTDDTTKICLGMPLQTLFTNNLQNSSMS